MVNKLFAFVYRVLRKNFYLQNAKILRKKYKLHASTIIKGNLQITGDFSCKEGCKFLGDITISGRVELGRYVSINGPNTDIISAINMIKIGSFTSIARNVSFQEFNHNYKGLTTYHINKNILKKARTFDINSKGNIEIGNDVWIGSHCVILSGAVIGNGAVVAANSVVTGEVPPFAIVGGSPAKIIKYRFDEETIKALHELQWWNWGIDKIKRNQDFFISPLSKELINGIK